MSTVCWQTILKKYHTFFFSKISKDVAKYIVCCSCDWRFKGLPFSDQRNFSYSYILLNLDDPLKWSIFSIRVKNSVDLDQMQLIWIYSVFFF